MGQAWFEGLPREERVKRIYSIMGITAALMALIGGVLISVAQQQGNDDLADFARGFMSTVPLLIVVMSIKAYLEMDDFARLRLLQAAALAFGITMVVAGGAMSLASPLSIPNWLIYAIGMGSWGIITLVQNLRDRRE